MSVDSKSTSFFINKNSSRSSDDGILPPFNNQNIRINNEPLDRFRRLIPFMAFYVPTTNADYLNYGPITNQMVTNLMLISSFRKKSLQYIELRNLVCIKFIYYRIYMDTKKHQQLHLHPHSPIKTCTIYMQCDKI